MCVISLCCVKFSLFSYERSYFMKTFKHWNKRIINLKRDYKMQACFFPIIKALLYVSLLVIFWIIFGSASVGRFEKQNVLVSSSTIGPDPEGLQVPAITICGRNTSSSMGWKGTKNPNITTLKEVLRHMCGEDQNVTKCIEDKTFGQGDI